MVHFRRPLALAALVALLSGCGGGGGSSPIPSTGGSGAAPTQPAQKTGPANMVIYIPPPSKQNTHFRPNYISAATQSMTVGLVSGATITTLATINLTQSSSNCTVPAGGGLQCTATVQAPFGTDTFAVSTYSATNGGGSLLSTGQIQETLQLGGTEPTVDVSLNGVPNTVSLALGSSTLPVGSAGSTTIIVQARDASGNLIIGPGVFANPINLAVTGDTYHTLSISYDPQQTNITSPGQVAMLNYTGGTNVGSTITATGSGITQPTPTMFNATGASMTIFQYADATNGNLGYPGPIVALPTGGAVALMDISADFGDVGYQGVATLSTTSAQKVFVGDTSDPYNVPAPGGLAIPGITVVNGMSTSIENWENDTTDFNIFGNLAVSPSGTTVYYSGKFSTYSAPGCSDEEEEFSGTIGALNTTNGTTIERVLSGYPISIKVDSSGNAWFVESTGNCSGSNLLGSDTYAIGKLTPSGAITETKFSAAGLGSLYQASDMTITPDGSQMFITDEDDGVIAKISTAALSSPTFAEVNNSYPVAIALASDGTLAWFSNDYLGQNSYYYYGYLTPSQSFTGPVSESTFPVTNFYADSMAYADGSFWLAGLTEGTGVGRLANVSSGSPLAGYYGTPVSFNNNDCECSGLAGQEIAGISAANGYVWAADWELGNIDVLQYGAPSNGTITFAARRIGVANTRPNPRKLKPRHAVTHRRR